ncbi:MAG: NAD-dependent epimerase/dehydratase family protein [Lachnospiraceae bacterium]|nr:NAD-dependent epimerase/dehydratase family protein [Lachnospiraceae bacterium]
MKKILITGAGSFIGTSFKKYIESYKNHAEYQISVMDTLTGMIVSDDTNISESDANAEETENTWNFSGFDVVFHVAGIAHADVGNVSEERKELYRKVNTELAIETAKKAKASGVGQFIFMSSAIVYGASSPIGKEKIITKDTKPEPENFYGESKLNAETGLLKLMENDSESVKKTDFPDTTDESKTFNVVILRPPMIYGPGCKGNYNSLRKFALKFPVFPKVANERSMLYIDNLCEFVRLMIDNEESGIFHPANRELSNTSEMVKMIAEAHGKKKALMGGLTWLLKLLSHATGLVNKAFGNLIYAEELAEYKENYRVYSLADSIRITEEQTED